LLCISHVDPSTQPRVSLYVVAAIRHHGVERVGPSRYMYP
jgi:hypothetical protein